jgi:hypothetical protein
MVRSEPPPRRPPFNKGGSKVRNNKHSVMANNTATNIIIKQIILMRCKTKIMPLLINKGI